MNRMLRLSWVIVLGLVVSGAMSAIPRASMATDYYVDCGPGGNNSNSGTSPTQPWATLAKAALSVPSGGNHVVHVKADFGVGICGEQGVTFPQSGTGSNCRSNDSNCFVIKGEGPCFCGTAGCASCSSSLPPAIVRASANGQNGIILTGSHVKFSNFRFTANSPNKYNVVLSTQGGTSPISDLLIDKVTIDSGVADKGIAILQSADVLVRDSSVSGTDSYAYGIHGNATTLSDNVVFFNDIASGSTAGNGFRIYSTAKRVTLDKVVSQNNADSGVFIDGNPPSGREYRLLGVQASGNGAWGINSGSSVYIENAIAQGNKYSGIYLHPGAEAASDAKRSIVVSSTIRDNVTDTAAANAAALWSQLRIEPTSTANHVFTIADSIIAKTSAAGAGLPATHGRVLHYKKQPGSRIEWNNNVMSRVESNQVLATFTDRDNASFDCPNITGFPNCDSVGDCNQNRAVDSAERALGRDISFDQAAVSLCRQFDDDGDSKVTIEERIAAAIVAAPNGAGHANIKTGQPTFAADGRHLTGASPGANEGVIPNDVPDLEADYICRADACDGDDDTRVGIGSGYDMGAFEGDGSQATNCSPGPGQCFTAGTGPATVTVGMLNGTVCSPGSAMVALSQVTGASGANLSGIQADLTFDPAKLAFVSCGAGSTSLTAEGVLLAGGNNKVRVMVGDFDASHNNPRFGFGNGNGAFQCTFNVIGGALASATSISVSNVVVSSSDGNRQPSAAGASGTFTPGTCCTGCC